MAQAVARPDLRVVEDAAAVARAGAEEIAKRAEAAVSARGAFTIALAGGSSPRVAYELLAAMAVPWGRTHFFWSDERHVAPDHKDSNYGMAKAALLDRIPVQPANVHRVRGEMSDAAEAARLYEEEVRKYVPGNRFDVCLLGLGPDAHTASLFPGGKGVHEQKRLVIAEHVAKVNAQRITFAPPLINASAAVLFLVAGKEKVDAVHQILRGERDLDRFPAQCVAPANGELIWLLDRGAAAKVA